ncbi:uncharacterized protein LOC141723469 [Apium graveolens]|uniref:uncharacterized protein LOC141723469 n=1 Tax=Apium graveolens TaxID=4045 RepID=UPI003D7B2CEB
MAELKHHYLEPQFNMIDSTSLFLSQFNSDQNLLQLKTESIFLERGPNYKAYADLRESKLRSKNKSPPLDQEPTLTPPRKQVKFQGSLIPGPPRRKISSVLAQSVPDFASVMRKENRKPMMPMAPVMEKAMTPPAASRSGKMYGVGARSCGSKSVNSGEKRNGGGLMGRKSYASMEELKGLSNAAANAINNGGETRGGRFGRTILGYKR